MNEEYESPLFLTPTLDSLPNEETKEPETETQIAAEKITAAAIERARRHLNRFNK